MKEFSFKKLAGVAVSAATLLALAPFSVANAATTQVPVDANTKGSIAIKAAADGSDTLTGRHFKSVRIGAYTNAQGDASTGDLKSVSIDTVNDPSHPGVISKSVTDAMHAAYPNEQNNTYNNNPVEALIQNHGSRDGHNGTDGHPLYDQDARAVVNALANDSAFLGTTTAMNRTSLSADNKTATFDNIPAGVYVVFEDTGSSKDSARSIPMLVSTGVKAGNPETVYNTINGTALGEVNLKATSPDIDKQIDKKADSHYMVGDDVPYTITSKVPRTTGYKNYRFVVTDKPSVGLTFNQSSLDVQIGNDHLNAAALGDKLQVTTLPGSSKQVIVMNLTSYMTELKPGTKEQKYPMGTDIKITYTMKINDDASSSVDNDATLTFSNDATNQATCGDNVAVDPATGLPKDDSTCATGVKPTHIHNNKVQLRSFKIHTELKSDGSNVGGTKFTVTDPKTNAPLRFTQSGATFKVASDQNNTANSDVVTAPADGKFTVAGLADDSTYTVSETDNGLGGSILPTFKVGVSGQQGAPQNDMITNTWDTWHLVDHERKAPVSANEEIVVFSVRSLSQLPLTGGAGAIAGVIVAVLLIGAAGGLYVFRRRENTAAIVGNAKVLR